MRAFSITAILLTSCDRAEADKDSDDADADTDTDTDTDTDGDTDADTGTLAVDADDDGFLSDVDCDDADANTYPGAPESCGDGKLTDCDGFGDDGLVTVDGVTSSDLQVALDGASPGATVVVCSGTWDGPFVAPVPVNLVAYNGSSDTVLDGNHDGTTLTLPPDSTITGFSLVHGRSQSVGGGMSLSAAGALTVDGCAIRQNDALLRGGGIGLPEGSTVVVSGSIIVRNGAGEGGGIDIPAGSTVDLTGSTVAHNAAVVGGGLMIRDGNLVGGLVELNAATGGTSEIIGGGGIGAMGTVTVTGTEIAENEAAYGAGFSTQGGSPLTLVDVSIHDNHAGSGSGGGGYVSYGDLVMLGATTLVGNTAEYGGGLHLSNSTVSGGVVDGNTSQTWGGGVYLYYSTATDVTAINNASVFLGGGVGSSNGSSRWVGGLISSNQADTGGGLMTTGDFTIEGAELSDNLARDRGGGISVLGIHEVRVIDAVVARNTANVGGGASLEEGGILVSTTSDWGAGADDNAPDDVDAGESFAGYGAGETFTCTIGCDPPP